MRIAFIVGRFPSVSETFVLNQITGAIRGKLLTAFHGYDVNSFPRDHGKDVYRKLFASGEAYTANTNFTADKAAALGCPREKITILPESLRVDLFPFTERKLAVGEG